MGMDINLLPKSELIDVESNSLVRLLKKASIFVVITLLVVGGLGGGLLYYLSRSASAAREKNTSLKSQIVGLESTEQGLVLLKDRLGKISLLMSGRGTNEAIIKQDNLLRSISSDLKFQELRVSSDEPYVSLSLPDLFTTADFLRSLSNNPNYQKVRLVGLSFNSTSGYEVSLTVK